MLNKSNKDDIIDRVRNSDNIINSKNSPELARRIKELSAEFMIKNQELYKKLEAR